jgi:lipopolysaccharide transport system permease protein
MRRGGGRAVTGGWGWRAAAADLTAGLKRRPLWTALGWLDVRQRFSGSILGSFWITANLAMIVAALTLVLARPLGVRWSDYVPYVAIGLVLWQFIQTSLNEAGTLFVGAAETIRNVPMPVTAHVMRLLWRNLIGLAHNLLVVAVVLILFRVRPAAAVWTLAPALLVLLATVFSAALAISIVGARFRDVTQIVTSLTQLLFFLTPVFWAPEAIGPARAWLVAANPVFALLDIVRAPLLGTAPAAASWPVALAAAAAAPLFGMALLARYRGRIAYWI